MRTFCRLSLLLPALFGICAAVSHAETAPFKPRAEANVRLGNKRNILMTEFMVPLYQPNDALFYGDLRLMGDSRDNSEGNLGVGYRKLLPSQKAVVGVHGWLDRRRTALGSTFHQATVGAEWLGRSFDARANAYLPLNKRQEHATGTVRTPYLAGSGIYVNQLGTQVEEAQPGFDAEIGVPVPLFTGTLESWRVYGGGYYFHGRRTDSVTGWRARTAVDVNPDIQLGLRLQRDAVRGSQGFLEATIRFPFGHKTSQRTSGLRARLEESPERDIDIVSADKVTDTGLRQVVNTGTGQTQQVVHVDNTASSGGNGSAENPFNTLAAAQAAAQANAVIYVHTGSGSTGMNSGITLDKSGQSLIGAGADFLWDGSRFGITGQSYTPATTLIAAATGAPVITNTAGDGVRVTADDVLVTGITVDGANRHGIVVEASGASASALNTKIVNVTATNNGMGILIHGADGGAVSAMVQQATTTGNIQHGIGIHDDTTNTFDVDLGGGGTSTGRNVLTGNGMEDLAVDYDGRQLNVQNNWWGQPGGPTAGNVATSEKAQVYMGSPLDHGLVGNWNFDNQWMNGTTIYDRSGNGNNGTANNGPTTGAGQFADAMHFDGANDYAAISGAYPSGSAPRTLSMWINSDDTVVNIAADHIVNYGATTTNQAFGVMIYTGNTWWVYGHTPSADINTTIPVTTGWQQHTLSYDGTTISYFINGVLRGTTNATLNTAAGNLILGGRMDLNGNNFFNGSLDDVRVYNRALTVYEAGELYRSTNDSTLDTSGALNTAP